MGLWKNGPIVPRSLRTSLGLVAHAVGSPLVGTASKAVCRLSLRSNTRLYFGTECVTGSVWRVWDSYSAAWVSTGAACGYTVSATAFNHLAIAVHRVAGDASCTGGYPVFTTASF